MSLSFFQIPIFTAVLYNEDEKQIMLLPDSIKDPGWKDIKITYGKAETLSVYQDNNEVAIIANRRLVPMIMACTEFYLGWINEAGQVSQRDIKVDTLSLYPL